MIALLVACSSSSSSTPPPPPVISVTLSTTPTALYVNDTAPIAATVAHDSANKGVTWSCAPAGTCGTFSASPTASGAAVTYTAPSTVPASTVVITATSVSDGTKSAKTPAITINPASGILVTLSAPPTATLAPTGTATIAATVTGDAANAGVNWTCAPASACGSFNPASTASAADTTYTAPAATGISTIIATAVSDNAQSARATVTITSAASGTLTPGKYVFSLAGTDTFDSPYFVSGVFTLEADSATISGGEEDFNDLALSSQISVPIASGSVVAANDGTGNLTITLNGGLPLPSPVQTLVATLVSNSKAAVIEYDINGTSSGTLDLQNPTAAAATPSAGYAFFLGGIDRNGNPLAVGGVLNVDGGVSNPGGISGTGSIFDANEDGSGTTYQKETFKASTVSTPDSFGRVQFTLYPTDSADFPAFFLAGYIVDATHIRLVDLDFNTITGGTAFGQGTNTGNFSSISGNSYVVGFTGADGFGLEQGAGQFIAGSSSFTGTVNYNDLSGTGVQQPDPVTEGTDTYTVDPTGRVSIPGMTDGAKANFNLQLYLDGNGNALAITLDTNDVLAGRGYQRTVGGLFVGTYVTEATGEDASNEYEIDAVGPITSAGTVGNFTGSVDLNWLFSAGPTYPDLTLSGAYTGASAEVYTGTIAGLDVTNGPSRDDAFTYYLIDSKRALAIETDPNQLTLGYFLLQQ